MKDWIRNNKLYFIGAAVGVVAGYIYWKQIGCLTGTCTITSNPYNSMAYFALLGALVFGIFKKQPQTKRKNP